MKASRIPFQLAAVAFVALAFGACGSGNGGVADGAAGGAAGSGGKGGSGGTTGSGGETGTGGHAGIGDGGSTGNGGKGGIGGTGLGGRGGSGGGADTGAAGAGGKGAQTGGGGPLCPGTVPRPAGDVLCKTASDCPSPYDACSAGVAKDSCASNCNPNPPITCGQDADCGSGKVCAAQFIECCDQAGWTCVPACTATSCSPDETCATSGHCQPKRCSDGFTCPSGTRCPGDAGGGTSDPHGCVPISCTEGYACPSSATCQPGHMFDDVHGCLTVTCTGLTCPTNQFCADFGGGVYGCSVRACATDADCDCGACIHENGVEGFCRSRSGVCSFLGSGGAQGLSSAVDGAGGVTGSGPTADVLPSR